MLGLDQPATTIIPQRLRQLGESVFAGVSVTWFMAAGTTCPDAQAVFKVRRLYATHQVLSS